LPCDSILELFTGLEQSGFEVLRLQTFDHHLQGRKIVTTLTWADCQADRFKFGSMSCLRGFVDEFLQIQ